MTTPPRASVSRLRRTAFVVGGVVVLSGVAPALAHVANPVALRAFGTEASPVPTTSAPPTPAPASASPEAEEPEEPEDADSTDGSGSTDGTDGEVHGRAVSTVAHCAPRGKDPLLAVADAPAHHGRYVSAAAHGDSLTTPWGTFDLSGQAGADALCAAIAAARADLPPAAPKAHGAKDRARKAKPAKPAKHKTRHAG